MNAPSPAAASAESAQPIGTAMAPAPFPAGPVQRLVGRGVAVVGNDIDTDRIIPARFLKCVTFDGLAEGAFADDRTELAGAHPFDRPEHQGATILVVNDNFGCGSSREQACSTLKGYDLAVVARSISRIFLQNSINLGLQVVICPGIEASEGDELEITADHVLNRTTGLAFAQVKLPAARKGIMDAGGLIPYTRARLMARG